MAPGPRKPSGCAADRRRLLAACGYLVLDCRCRRGSPHAATTTSQARASDLCVPSRYSVGSRQAYAGRLAHGPLPVTLPEGWELAYDLVPPL